MVKCQDIQFTPISGRTVRLTGDLSKCDIEEIHGVIISITCKFPECDYTVKLGDTIRPRAKSPARSTANALASEMSSRIFSPTGEPWNSSLALPKRASSSWNDTDF